MKLTSEQRRQLVEDLRTLGASPGMEACMAAAEELEQIDQLLAELKKEGAELRKRLLAPYTYDE